MTRRKSVRVLAIVQARMASSRFPGKILRPVGDRPLIGLLLDRLALSRHIDAIILATSTDSSNQPLVRYARERGIEVFEGSEDDVLGRFYGAAAPLEPEIVVRITGDCPLVDPAIVDALIEDYDRGDADYVSNIDPPTYPDGLDVEVFSFTSLERTVREATSAYDREHVTPYIRSSGCFRTRNSKSGGDWAGLRWTVDEPADLAVVQEVVNALSPRWDFGWQEVLTLHQQFPELFGANQMIKRNEGAQMGRGQKLWKRAKQIIPGGNMLLSKRAEMFLPEQWPAYFSRARGCHVWDLDGREYVDMSIMGIGTNTLGYGRAEVDDAVHRAVNSGNMSTLNCPEEVALAERLVALNPWADMVRFTRSGGEANAVAVRIARAASGKDQVAFCGYHGWHDWYLAANLGDDESLAGHLLPGLEPKGVPRALRGTVSAFNYNDFEALQRLADSKALGVIIMEVVRNRGPENGFLERVRELATGQGIVLIFDECTSGFRQTFGGLHQQFGVQPDIAMYGKALGNGYAINAVVGRRAVMEAAQATFISSTFWTERIGPAAALATLEVMERERSWERITEIGKGITGRWKALASHHGLSIQTSGLSALTSFSFAGTNALAYKTLVTQEMLRHGFLASNSVYVCLDHTEDVVDQYFEHLDKVFLLIGECERGRDVSAVLEGPVCHAGFRRLN